MRFPGACGGSATIIRLGPPDRASSWSRPDLSRAADAIFETGELLDADRPARVEAAGSNADLCTEAELAAVGELGRGVVQHDRRIDLAQKALGGSRFRGDDRIGVVGAIALDVVDRAADAVDHLGGDDGVEILRRPVLLVRRLDPPIDAAR